MVNLLPVGLLSGCVQKGPTFIMTFDSNRLKSSVKNVSRRKIYPLQAVSADAFGQFLLFLHLLWSFRRHFGLENEQKVGQSGYYLHVSRRYAYLRQ